MTKPLITFQNVIGYTFKIPQILKEALTHKSYAHEYNSPEIFKHNERLEFLGDAVLDLVVSNLLMMQDFQASEGELSKRRAALVNEQTLAEVARALDISDYLILGRGEMTTRGREKDSILSSAFEALIGAVFLDGGYEGARVVIEKTFTDRIAQISANQPFERDYKSRFQEIVQQKRKLVPIYKIDRTEGPEHQKTFYVSVFIEDVKVGEGKGKSRKDAEQDAARSALERTKL